MSKQKPNCLESEKGVLGSVLLDPSRMKNCISLSSKHFYTERHKYLWDALREMYVQNIDMDALTVRNYLKDKKILHQCGGEEYLLELQDSTIVPSHSQSYRNRVLETYDLREEIEVYESGLIKAYDGQSSIDRVMSSLIRKSITPY